MDLSILLDPARRFSRGPFLDPPLSFYNGRVLLGPGAFLQSPVFVRSRRITHIINVGEADACPGWVQRSFGARYTHIPCYDNATEQIFEKYPAFEKTLNTYLKQGGVVYVHCQAGMNRSATLLVGYVAKQSGSPLESIVHHAVRQRPCILMNPFFNKQLIDFAKKHTKE
jgi:hypothetical protein